MSGIVSSDSSDSSLLELLESDSSSEVEVHSGAHLFNAVKHTPSYTTTTTTTLVPMATEPSPRWSHLSALVGEKLYLYGGLTADFYKQKSELVSKLHLYDPYMESWDERQVQKSPLLGLYDGACASSECQLYVFGGSDGSRWQGSLHQLDTRTLTWTQLASAGPMKKIGSSMVSYGDYLLLFGGYGVLSGPIQPGAQFMKSNDDIKDCDEGWVNELHRFDLKEGTWSSPTVSGTRPPPCAYFSLTMIDDHRAVLFGGRLSRQQTTNNVYIIDLTTMHWSKVDFHDGEPCPVGRSKHAAACLGCGRDHPQLLITGGVDKDQNTLNDAWVLDLESKKWREVKESRLQARCCHSVAAISLAPGLTELTVFGGQPKKSDIDTPSLANTTVLRFEYQQCPSTGGVPTREWVLTDLADSSQLGTSQRVREKMVKMSQATHTSTPVTASGEGAAKALRELAEVKKEALRAERVAKELGEKTTKAERVVEEVVTQYKQETRATERRLAESEQREQESEERARDAETRAVEAERKWRGAMTRAEEAEERAREWQKAERNQNEYEQYRERVQRAEQKLSECEDELQQLQTRWAVERREIQVTNQEIGRGSWATVSVATFRGIRVAAKVIHNQIVSQHNICLFKREMDMAARVRHPNLLQFIGATLEGEVNILTELMPTSLRKELEGEYMSPKLVISIGLDVVRALNYLHLMRPHPLIHRDISSANVLLEPLPNNRWRAKVSDYGTVNLQEHLQTVGPGNPCYAAPEANDPTRQSPKMDIFSFGALLMEMLTGELPASDERPRLLSAIRHQHLLTLIRRCLSENREDRPSASDIISELDT